MRFGIDARHLAARRGVARSTRETLLALARAHPEAQWRCLVPGHAPVALDAPENVTLVRTHAPGRVVHGAAAVVRRPRLDALLGGDLDAVWIPAPAPVAVSPAVPYVLTVHDLSWEDAPAHFTAYERAWHRLARPSALAQNAVRVTAVSHATAAAVAQRWGVEAGRVLVAPPGVTRAEPVPAPARDGVFFLFVGALEPRKGVAVLAQAWRAALAAGLDADLVVVGEGREAGRLDGLARVVRVAHAGDGELAALLRDAVALVAPSLDEGFGMVPLEAAAQGTPAIVSALPAVRETLGDAATFVPAGDPGALARALTAVAADPAAAARTGAAARERAAAYTWEATAAVLWRALTEASGA